MCVSVCVLCAPYISPDYEWQTTYHQHIIVYFYSHHLNVLDAGQVGTLDDELEARVGPNAFSSPLPRAGTEISKEDFI